MPSATVGIIGGTGLYEIEGLTDIETINIGTPFGDPSDAFIIGKLSGIGVAFLPRHGRGHTIMPSELPSRANIYAMKSLGVEHIIAVNSAGSFKEEIRPGTLVIPDQVIDCTKGRISTFFGGGIVAHISLADPFCPDLSDILYDVAVEVGASVRKNGTFIAMEGPAFSTRAESNLYRSWDADIIGMTVLPEAKLAREAEICYASIVCVTDYDCWMERTKAVDVGTVLNYMRKNTDMAKAIIRRAVTRVPQFRRCGCAEALNGAIVTAPEQISAEQKERLGLIIGKYLS
ncbi:MAG: S-methyl-5'-thioadenosine phosphorylase [Dehalococcoidales bacterium]|nr:S-methyl-5'-thioadenosine phosphorylase [Dehalococcoidales bacterium]